MAVERMSVTPCGAVYAATGCETFLQPAAAFPALSYCLLSHNKLSLKTQVTNEAFWRIKYFAVLDSVIENLIRRFSNQSLELAHSVDNFVLLDFKESKLFINHYKDLFQIDTETLMAEMTVAKNAFQTTYQNQVLGDPEKMATIINEATFPNLYKLLGVAYTLPISSATCERSFSAMRRVKTWLRSTMIQERFTNLSIIHIERDISNNIDTEKILNNFANSNDRKIPLIY
ncbi:uncharacterized protein LOC126549211 [Aphis gossypii]|uniref:uncharacterized protein LOC126549211 n=1 Tax=Aphis gossypii TaxID=80765 RepID=UPI002158E0AE|nr:uncharacterized protein LOC126549211 [Aphis gossypii]